MSSIRSEADDIEGSLPALEWLCLDYPAYVENETEALKTIGGADALPLAEDSGDGLLPMLFSPDNPLSHFIYAGRTESKSLVLQITKKHCSDGDPEISAQLKARISATYKFSGMCDFCFTRNGLPIEEQSFVSSDAMESTELDNLVSEDPRFSQEPLLNVPPLFSKLDCPIESILKEKSTASHFEKGHGQSAKYAIPFSSPNVPQRKNIPVSAKEKFPEILSHIDQLFEKRPIWSEAMLVLELSSDTPREAFLNLLSLKCYRFRDGPWQKLWILRGFDPRLDISARIYQAFIYTFPSNWYVKSIRSGFFAKIRQKYEHNSIHQLNSFQSSPLTKCTLLQCCDLEDTVIHTVLKDLANGCKKECSQTTGWFTNEAWNQIYCNISTRFQEILNQEASEANEQCSYATTENCPAEHLISFLTDLPDNLQISDPESEETEEQETKD